jgi:hypothetical protein
MNILQVCFTLSNLKLEIVAVAVLAAGLIGATTISGARVFGQANMTGNMTGSSLVTSTYGGVDIDSNSATIECAGEIKGPVKTEGIVADAYIRHGEFKGTWNIVNDKKEGEDKGGKITSGWTKEGKYELKGVEEYDGICKATVPKDITISGFCGNGEKINYVTVGGKSDTFKGNVRCYTQ